MRLTIKAKLFLGFGIVLGLILVMGVVSSLMARQVDEAHHAALVNMEEIIFLVEREVDHVNYMGTLANSFIEQQEFTGQLDYTRCNFGVWYYDILHSDRFALTSPEFQETFAAIEKPHIAVHNSAARIVELTRRATGEDSQEYWDRAERIYRGETLVHVQEFRRLLNELKEIVNVEREQYLQYAEEQGEYSENVLITGLVLAIIIGLAVALLIGRSITAPLKNAVDYARHIGEGDLTREIPAAFISRKDEIGELSEALAKMVMNLRQLIEHIIASSGKVNETSESLAASSQEMSASLEEVAASSNDFAGNAQNLGESAQDMSESGMEISRKAVKGDEAIGNAVEQMKVISGIVENLHEVVDALDRRSQEIGKIVGTIKGIAEQTNLLALNAAIEAARAGDQGRGFAVVAEEVRKLAEQSSTSASEITELIQATQRQTQSAVEDMSKGVNEVKAGTEVIISTGEIFKSIVEAVENIARQIEHVAHATEEISSGSEEISAAVQQQTATMGEVSEMATDLQGMVSDLVESLKIFKY